MTTNQIPQSAPETSNLPPIGLLTKQEVAQQLRVSVRTVEVLTRNGVLPSVKLGRCRRFLQSSVAKALIALQA